QILVEDPLGFGLRQKEDERIPGIRSTDPAEFSDGDGMVLKVEDETVGRASGGREPVPQSETLEDLERSRLDAERPGFSDAIVPPIDDPERGAEGAELCGQREP